MNHMNMQFPPTEVPVSSLIPKFKHHNVWVCPFLNNRDQVWHTYKTMGTVVVLYILIFTSVTGNVKVILCILNFVFLIQQLARHVDHMIASIAWNQHALRFFMNAILICQQLLKYLNCATLPKDSLVDLMLQLFPTSCSQDWNNVITCLHELLYHSSY